MTGTELFRRALANFGDRVEQSWGAAPWVVTAYEGRFEGPRQRDMVRWCAEQFGPEAWPLHGRTGRWQRGSVTINGWTWFGFDTEAAMVAFEAAWPTPAGVTPLAPVAAEDR